MWYLSAFLFVAAGVAKSVQDTIAHHYTNSIFSTPTYNALFWNPKRSWINKYKKTEEGVDINREKFFGSTTFLVAFTDAWHLFQFLHINLLIIATTATAVNDPVLVIVGVIVYRVAFELFYSSVWKKKI